MSLTQAKAWTTLVLPGSPVYCRLPKGLFISSQITFFFPFTHMHTHTLCKKTHARHALFMKTSLMECELESTKEMREALRVEDVDGSHLMNLLIAV